MNRLPDTAPGPAQPETGRFLPKAVFRVLVLLLLGFLAAVQITTIREETQTYDEAIHLSAGYSYWKTGEYRLNPEHPPLGKLLAALPLLWLKPHLPLEHEAWQHRDGFAFGTRFLYGNRIRPDRLLFYGRLPTILLTVALGFVLAAWAKRHFGAGVALAALVLYCLDPNVIAHGRYVTTDLIVTLFIFAACLGWARYLESERLRHLLVAAILLGLALASKYSALILLIVLPLVTLLDIVIRRPGKIGGFPRLRRLARLSAAFAVALVLAFSVLGLTYGKATWQALRSRAETAPDWLSTPSGDLGRAVHRVAGVAGLQEHPYLLGVYEHERHEQQGHAAYLVGRHTTTGWWYYFPAVFALKTPVAPLLLLVLAAVCAVLAARRRRSRLHGEKSSPPLRWMVLIVPPTLYLILSMMSSINLGIRHLLPIYPFLFVLLPAAVWRSRLLGRRALIAAAALLCSIHVFEFARTYPYFLPYINSLAGHSARAPQYLADSNVDWGQDLKRLKRYMDEHGLQHVCLAYFGRADAAHYGIGERALPFSGDLDGLKHLDCVAAISATLLVDTYLPPGSYAWVRQLRPAATVGHSIYIYDLRKKPGPPL